MSGRRSRLVPAIFALAGIAVLIALGSWQISRKHWKEALIESLTQRLSAPPGALPAVAQWNSLSQTENEFRRVAFRAEFIHAQEAYVYTAGSALRPDVSGPGFWVFTPARLADGSLVVVNRGFVPQDRQKPQSRAEGQVPGAIEIAGAMRWPEERGWFAPQDDASRNIWYVRDHTMIATAKQWGAVARFFVDQETPAPPGGLPKPGPLAVNLRNEHLQYAMTWFALAAVLGIVFIVWARGRRAISET